MTQTEWIFRFVPLLHSFGEYNGFAKIVLIDYTMYGQPYWYLRLSTYLGNLCLTKTL